MKRIGILLTALFLVVCAASCGAEEAQTETGETVESSMQADAQTGTGETVDSSMQADAESGSATTENREETEEHIVMKMNVQIGDRTFAATLEDNAAVREFVELMEDSPVTIAMRDYSGFEKVGPLGKRLSADDRQTTTVPGDIVLYNGDQIVLFYGSNSWSYTRIGRIDDLTGWADALGSGGITAVFTLAK